MAIILRGKNKGKKVLLRQWCNDWCVCSDGKVHGITSLLFTDNEIKKLEKSLITGIMFTRFEIKNNRFFKKKCTCNICGEK